MRPAKRSGASLGVGAEVRWGRGYPSWLGIWTSLLLCLAVFYGCGTDSKTKKPQGELMVGIGTDMSSPEDLDRILVQVRIDGRLEVDEDYQLAPGGDKRLPGLIPITGEQADTPVEVIAIGLLESEARVFARVTTTFPDNGQALLQIPLQWLCDGSAQQQEDGSYESTCEEGLSCRFGSCEDPAVPLETLPSYDPTLVFGGGETAEDSAAQCFDTVGCLDAGTDAEPDRDCVVELPSADGATPNVGLVLPGGTQGICGETACYIPLDMDPVWGWSDPASAEGSRRAQLPEIVCEKLASGDIASVRVSAACETKTPRYPTCGPWSAVSQPITVTLPSSPPEDDGADDGQDEPPADDTAEEDDQQEDDTETPPDTEEVLPTIETSTGLDTVSAGGTIQLTIPGVEADDVEWSSTNSQVATINENGLVTGVSAGTTIILADLGGELITFELTVDLPAEVSDSITIQQGMARLAVLPEHSEVPAGLTAALTAVGWYTNGTSEDVSGRVRWSSQDEAVATVSQSGLVTAVAEGVTTIVAEGTTLSNGEQTVLRGSAEFTVSGAQLVTLTVTPQTASIPSGLTVQLTAQASFTDGTTRDVSSIAAWASTGGGVVAVDDAGLVTAVEPGTAEVVAALGGSSASSAVDVTDAEPVSLVIIPQTTQLPVGIEAQLSARASFTDGTTRDVSSDVAWATSDSGVATVDATGLVHAVATGHAAITTELRGIQAMADVQVNAPSLVSLTVSPAEDRVAAGLTTQFVAGASFDDGTTHDVTSSVQWASANLDTATVAADGVVRGVSPGSTEISAQLGGATASAVLVVDGAILESIQVVADPSALPLGRSLQLSALGSYSDGRTDDVTDAVQWASADVLVLTVDAGGVAHAASVGSTHVSATLDGVSGVASLEVSGAAVEQLTLSPTPLTVPTGVSQPLTATVAYSDGHTEVNPLGLVWTSAAPNLATVLNGQVTGVAPGTTSVSASIDGVTAEASVIVTSAALESVSLAPAQVTLAAGTAQTLAATASYSGGQSVPNPSGLSWTSSNSALATVAGGTVQGVAPGTVTITATLDGRSGTSTVTVTDAELVGVSLADVTLPDGTSVQAAATVSYSDGSSVINPQGITWTSGNTAIATVVAGLVTGQSVGETTITAAIGGQSATAAVSVTSAVVDFVSVTNISLPSGMSAPVAATVTYTNGSTEDNPEGLTWTTGNEEIATVGDGLVTGQSVGETTITATFEGVPGSATVTVTNPVPFSVEVAPASLTIDHGATQALQVVVTYTDDSTRDDPTLVDWTSSNTDIVTVSADGAVTGAYPGTATITATLGNLYAQAEVTVVPTVTGLYVAPASNSLMVTESAQLTAIATLSTGAQVDVTAIAYWSSSDPSIVGVSITGQGTAMAPGSALVTATYEGRGASAHFSVVTNEIVSLEVVPNRCTEGCWIEVTVGIPFQLTAIARYADERIEDVSSRVTWNSSDQSYTITPDGQIVAPHSDNWTRITASIGELTSIEADLGGSLGTLAYPEVIHLAPGEQQQIDMHLTDIEGEVHDVAGYEAASFTIVQGSGIDPAIPDGLIIGQQQGAGVIQVAFYTYYTHNIGFYVMPQSDIRDLWISSGELASGASRQITVTGYASDQTQHDLTGNPNLSWTSDDPNVLSVSATGVVTAANIWGGNFPVTIHATWAPPGANPVEASSQVYVYESEMYNWPLVAVLEDRDSNSTDPPFEDHLGQWSYNYNGSGYGWIDGFDQTGLNLSQTIGGNRAVSVSPNGAQFVITENAAGTINIHGLDGWYPMQITGYPFIAAYAAGTRIYALADGTDEEDSLEVYNYWGTHVGSSTTLRGFDLVVDEVRGTIWTTGSELRRGSTLDLEGTAVASFDGAAVSIDLAADGSVWVADRDNDSPTGTIRHFSESGAPLESYALGSSPSCVRVNPATGDLWVAHSSGVSRITSGGAIYDAEAQAPGGYWSLAVDQWGYVVAGGDASNAAVNIYRADGTIFWWSIPGPTAVQKYVSFVGR